MSSSMRSKKKYPDQLLMADCSTIEEALHADELGFDFIGTTMVGYTKQSKDLKIDENDFEILRIILSKVKHPVIAEGNINTPAKLKRVLELGAFLCSCRFSNYKTTAYHKSLQMLSNKSIFKRIMYGLLCKIGHTGH